MVHKESLSINNYLVQIACLKKNEKEKKKVIKCKKKSIKKKKDPKHTLLDSIAIGENEMSKNLSCFWPNC